MRFPAQVASARRSAMAISSPLCRSGCPGATARRDHRRLPGAREAERLRHLIERQPETSAAASTAPDASSQGVAVSKGPAE